jgi:hypothetical protein
MKKRPHLTTRLRRQLSEVNDALQLAMWRRILWVNRSAARARRWAEPYREWLWLPAVTLVVGFFGGYLTSVR